VRAQSGDVFWVSLSGAAQLTGATLYVMGRTVPAESAHSARASRYTVDPVLTRDFAGLNVTGRL
jgi:hypothetical protein